MAHEQLIFRNIEVLPSTWQIWKGQGDAEKESEQFPYMAFVQCEGINSYSTGLRVTFDQSDPTISLFAPFAETIDGGINIFASRQIAEVVIIKQIVCNRN